MMQVHILNREMLPHIASLKSGILSLVYYPMKTKESTGQTKIRPKPFPSPPENLTVAECKFIMTMLEDIRLGFHPDNKSPKRPMERVNNLYDSMVQWRKQRKRLNEILSCPATLEKFLEEYRLHGRANISDFPLPEMENATPKREVTVNS